MSTDSSDRRAALVVWLLLACQAAFGLHTAITKSVTHDELWHLPVGLINLTQGRFEADNLNPPLTRMWDAAPLAIAGLRGDPVASRPMAGLKFVEAHPGDFQRWYVWGRVFNLVFSVATGWLLARWARKLWGSLAAIGVTLLYATCPNILAHASIVTPDAGLMLGCLASLYLFWRWSERRTWRNAVVLGIVLGLAQAAKYTAVLLYPVLGGVWLGLAVLPHRRTGSGGPGPDVPTARVSGWQFPAAVIVSLVVLNAAYLFHGTGRRLGEYAFQSQSLSVASAALGAVNWLPVPLPRDYLEGLDAQRAIMEGAHPVFLDGAWSVTGFAAYYPKTLLYKLPHPLQLAVIVGLLSTLLIRRARIPIRVHALIVLLSLGLLGTAAGTSMQLGVRYILPLLPLGMLYAGGAFRMVEAAPRGVRIAIMLITTVACGLSLRHHPHHLAYFNEYAGGPVGGREHLLDSNIDWGQDLNLVRDYMREQKLPTIGLAYFGTVPPELLGINYTLPPGFTPQSAGTFRLPPGWYAVSVNYVMGRPHTIHEPDGGSHGVGLDEFGYFRQFEPVARLGYSIDVYRVE